MAIEETPDRKDMADTNNNSGSNSTNNKEEQTNTKDPESNSDRQSHRRLLPFSLEIDRFENKYYRRSIHTVICLILFIGVVFINIIGIELFFSFFENTAPAIAKFEIRPRPNEKNLIHLKKNNLDLMVDDIRTYLSNHNSNCESSDDYFCFVRKEINSGQCSEIRSYGLRYGTPCILVGLKPVANRLNTNITGDNSRIHLKCDGISNVDKENVGPVEYLPRNGVPISYLKKNGSEVPFVFVHLLRPTYGVVVVVKCNVFWESENEMVMSEQSFQFETLIDF